VIAISALIVFEAAFGTAVVQAGADRGRDPERDAEALHHLVPGDSRRGGRVFLERGCGECHRPGAGGVPLPTGTEGPLTAGEIAARLWNHAPRMWDRMAVRGRTVEPMTSRQMADLFAYLFYGSLVDSPGDPAVGALLFRYKQCGSCHESGPTEGDERFRGPAVHYWNSHTRPLELIGSMWNHAEWMKERIRLRGGRWPELDGEEINHIVAYVRGENTIAEPRPLLMGDPSRGMGVFRQKGCAGCHPAVSDDRHRGPGIDAIGRKTSTLSGLAGRMWSHYPVMVEGLDRENIRRLRMSVGEIDDLVAYLFAVGYFDEVGDPDRGARVFRAKGCAGCHTDARGGGRGIAWLRPRVTPADFARSLWNHGPRMSAAMRTNGRPWPELDRRDVVDLIAYVAGD
jgi:mono/diheme cytochrome c family protein